MLSLEININLVKKFGHSQNGATVTWRLGKRRDRRWGCYCFEGLISHLTSYLAWLVTDLHSEVVAFVTATVAFVVPSSEVAGPVEAAATVGAASLVVFAFASSATACLVALS